MSVTFILRTPYDHPSGRFIKRFRHESVLGWFQSIWNNGKDCEELLGYSFYGGVGHLLDARIDEDLPCPKNASHLCELLRRHSYSTNVEMRSGCLEIQTDDDEMYLCQYFIDSKFIERNPNRVAYLTRDKWLPVRVEKGQKSRPKTFVAARYPSQTCDSAYFEFFEISGTRLERIANILEVMEAQPHSDCYTLKEFLRTVSPELSWKQTIQQFLAKTSDGFKCQSTFKLNKHICEFNHHEKTWSKPVFSHLVVFDDLWAKTYPALVKSLRRFCDGQILFSKSK